MKIVESQVEEYKNNGYSVYTNGTYAKTGKPRYYVNKLSDLKEKYVPRDAPRKPKENTPTTIKKKENRVQLNAVMKELRRSLSDRITHEGLGDEDIQLLQKFLTAYNPVKLKEYTDLKLPSKL